MAKPCSICLHADVTRIDAWLKSGKPYREIAGRFSVSKSALARHRPHLAQAVRKIENDPERALDQLGSFDQDAAWRSIDQKIAEWNRDALEVSRQPPPARTVSTRKTGASRRGKPSSSSEIVQI
jgi:hypothetical protein